MSVDAFLSTGIDPLELMKRPKQWFVDQVRKYRGAFGSCLHFRSLGKTLLPHHPPFQHIYVLYTENDRKMAVTINLLRPKTASTPLTSGDPTHSSLVSL